MARILFADDDHAMGDLARLALQADGHIIKLVSDGQEALDALTSSPAGFDLLVTDIQMPALDGLQLAHQAVALRHDLRILLMSAFVTGVSVPASVSGNVRGMLTKPISREELRSAVLSALE